MNIANIKDTIHLRKTVPKDWSWIKTDKRKIRKKVKGFRNPETFAISETIDKTIDILIIQFQNIIDLSIPRYKAQRSQIAR